MKTIEPQIEVENYDPIKIMKNIEKAMRNCYRSENFTTEDSYKRLLGKAINSGHLSVLEHEKITVKMCCSIAAYKDLTRHRFASFSIESTRYCGYNKDKFDGNVTFIKPCNLEGTDYLMWQEAMKNAENSYMQMAAAGLIPDQTSLVLPQSTAAEVVMTCNIREWKHILELRCAKTTRPEIQQILIPLLLKFKEDMPELFNDTNYNIDFPIDKYAKINVMTD